MVDYIFYRFYDLYKRKEGDVSAFSASAVISFIQILVTASIILSANFIVSIFIGKNYLTLFVQSIDKRFATVLVVLLSVSLLMYNNLKYKKKLGKIIQKYSNSHLNKKVRMWFIFLIIPGSMLFPFGLRYVLNIFTD